MPAGRIPATRPRKRPRGPTALAVYLDSGGGTCGRFQFRLENAAVPAAPDRRFGDVWGAQQRSDRPAAWQTAEQWYESYRRLPGYPHPTGWTPPIPRAILRIGESKFLHIRRRHLSRGFRACPPSRRRGGPAVKAHGHGRGGRFLRGRSLRSSWRASSLLHNNRRSSFTTTAGPHFFSNRALATRTRGQERGAGRRWFHCRIGTRRRETTVCWELLLRPNSSGQVRPCSSPWSAVRRMRRQPRHYGSGSGSRCARQRLRYSWCNAGRTPRLLHGRCRTA